MMIRFRLVLFLVAIAVVLQQQIFVSAEEKKVLKGYITIDDALSPMPPELRPGQIFDETSSFGSQEDMWYRMPGWFSGHWKFNGVERARRTNLLTGLKEQRDLQPDDKALLGFGTVKDDEGRIWDRMPTNRWRGTKYKDLPPGFSLCRLGEVSQPDEDHFVIKSVDFRVELERNSKRIVCAYQSETVWVYSRISPTQMTAHDTSRHYDINGNAQMEKILDSNMEKFREVDFNSPYCLQAKQAFDEFRRTKSETVGPSKQK